MAPVKESFATRMPNVSDRLLKDAESASVKMVGRETGEHALVRLYNYNFNWSYIFISEIKGRTRMLASFCGKQHIRAMEITLTRWLARYFSLVSEDVTSYKK